MNKNNIIGFVLIGVIMFGFTWYQSKQYEKQAQAQAQLDSIAFVEQMAAMASKVTVRRTISLGFFFSTGFCSTGFVPAGFFPASFFLESFLLILTGLLSRLSP